MDEEGVRPPVADYLSLVSGSEFLLLTLQCWLDDQKTVWIVINNLVLPTFLDFSYLIFIALCIQEHRFSSRLGLAPFP